MDIFDLHCDTLYRAVTEDISLDCPAAEVQLNRDAGCSATPSGSLIPAAGRRRSGCLTPPLSG